MELDDLDKGILSEVIRDSRSSYRQIAKKLSASPATIMHRINKLEKEGIIKRYSAILDYDKIGYDVEVLIEIRISKGKLFEVEKEIANNPYVSGVYDVTGDFDAVMLARFPSRRKMDAFIKRLQTFDFVERTNTRMILNTIKEKHVDVI